MFIKLVRYLFSTYGTLWKIPSEKKVYFWTKEKNVPGSDGFLIKTTFYSSLNKFTKIISDIVICREMKNRDIYVVESLLKLIEITRINDDKTHVVIYLPFRFWMRIMTQKNDEDMEDVVKSLKDLAMSKNIFILPSLF